MINQKPLFCLIGASGSGKTAIAECAEREFGFPIVRSYTTRPKRENDTSHNFVSESEFDNLPLIEQAEYSGNRYGTTKELLDNALIHIVEPEGFQTLNRVYGDSRRLIAVYVYASERTRAARMSLRGDTAESIEKRLKFDREHFADVSKWCDYTIKNEGISLTEAVGWFMFISRLENGRD